MIDLDGNKQRYRVGEVLQPLPEQGHSWHVFPQMDTDEVLLLKACSLSGSRCVCATETAATGLCA